jgi:hypothetical protein
MLVSGLNFRKVRSKTPARHHIIRVFAALASQVSFFYSIYYSFKVAAVWPAFLGLLSVVILELVWRYFKPKV